jgi:hypothetical protein
MKIKKKLNKKKKYKNEEDGDLDEILVNTDKFEIINIFVKQYYSSMISIIKKYKKYFLFKQGVYGNVNFSSQDLNEIYKYIIKNKGDDFNFCKNVFDHKIITNYNKKEINTIIGDDDTFGHYYWQDLSWFFYILENKKLNYFKTIYIYHDKMNLFNLIKKLVKDNNCNTEIRSIYNLEEIDNNIPLFKFRLNRVTKNQRIQILNYYDSLYKNKITLNKDYYYINIFVRIKKEKDDCIFKYYDSMKKLVFILREKYGKKIKFILDGYINFEKKIAGNCPCFMNLLDYDEEFIKFINPDINLINKNINDIIPYYYDTDLFISVPGSGLTIPGYIYNRNIICIDDFHGVCDMYKEHDTFYESIDRSKVNYFRSNNINNMVNLIEKKILEKEKIKKN